MQDSVNAVERGANETIAALQNADIVVNVSSGMCCVCVCVCVLN